MKNEKKGQPLALECLPPGTLDLLRRFGRTAAVPSHTVCGHRGCTLRPGHREQHRPTDAGEARALVAEIEERASAEDSDV